MRIVTFNVNGIRAATRRGFVEWLSDVDADVIALQEVRCRAEQLPDSFGDYHVSYCEGNLAGRNGVAIMTRNAPKAVRTWNGKSMQLVGVEQTELDTPDELPLEPELEDFRQAGRWIEVDLADAPVTVASLYLPKGDSPYNTRNKDLENAKAKYDSKMSFLSGFAKQLSKMLKRSAQTGRELVIVGDYNIAHTNLDLKNWKGNQKSSGFLPEERQWLDSIISPDSLVDVSRDLHPGEEGPYTWWSWRGKAFNNDAGWRIDYQLATPKLAARAETSKVWRAPDYASRVSDHAALAIDYKI
ncbi:MULTISPECIES: exodeoxyribonuclease III [Propionimicrobium]|uniref:exodeoxyribonuclease III n=1 Tax=Propionimicrobium TaxID=203133 RepID=UPI0003D798A4|nr:MULTISPECIES: exodeoxyribonuclease III [Propionimicrobium]ETJ97683.1 exodeoxyribonuclease III [Propionimicrobium sp. BV2F7]